MSPGRSTSHVLFITALAGLFWARPVVAQPASQPATAPAGARPIFAEVIEVHGDVRAAPLGTHAYKPVRLHDQLPPGTRLLTGIRSSVKLRIGQGQPYTCVLVEQVGLTVLSEAWRSRQLKKVRIGVGFGRIRAGVAEGGIESDLTIDCPVATLSKRGTWGIMLYYERATDDFEAGLTDRGLIEVIDRLKAQRRTVAPHELVNAAMRRWLDQAPMHFNVPVADVLGQGTMQIAFNRIRSDGIGVINPGAGRSLLIDLRRPAARQAFARTARRALATPPAQRIVPLRPEGFFGTGRGDELLGVLLDAASPLVQKGFARPGLYHFRRSTVESWLRHHGK